MYMCVCARVVICTLCTQFLLPLLQWTNVILGLHFIEKNSSYIMDDKSDAPIGFNIIFPGMVRLGTDLGLEFPLKQYDV